MNFAEIIKSHRKAKGLTQYQLAVQLGIEPSLVAKYERGDVKPLFDRALAHLATLGLSLQVMNNEVGSER